ncbi:BREX-1 system adenine-specific DNA-methyltransferase PglX [Holophaga foetida]|uniref:BREX-1 system adenine-specific DNA-methyltransferase PglX n=1 Tax=Holophaga foetida TaxID=35839 RepID=UPI000247173C|nr:BREX-1 system adenine-specific DNA-methyltransferase PglX [Holophaga foetida]
MDRSKLKTYAPQARRDFIAAMKARAALLGITDKGIAPATIQGDSAIIQGQAFPKVVEVLRQRLALRIEGEGFEQVMEAMAYTWFNRFAALRYMELHGYLDHGYRVLSHPEGKATPEILEQAEHLDLPGLKREQVVDLKLEGKEQELYRLLLVAQCNALHQAMPFLFEAIEDETELLLPDNLLHSDSLIRKLVSNLDAEDCESVEVLGWLYQFYIAEKKDTVMARKSAVPTEDIPAVTQLFTPHWIVRYLVENSLGRLWLLNRPGSRLREQMPYYIEPDPKDAPETDFLKITKPEEIRLMDPAVGSGHMLTYAFDLLFLIYQEEGYAPTTISGLILRHNLHGLDLCPRAAQLAGLALVFKAREKSRRFFQVGQLVQPNIIELRDVCFVDNELRDYIQALGLGDLFSQPMLKLLHQFEEAKNFGSLIQPCLDEASIAFVRSAIEAKGIGGQLFLRETHLKVLRVLEQAEALTQRYHVVVANPPYMGSKNQTAALKGFLETNFEPFKADLFSAFFIRSRTLALSDGFLGFMSPFVWMFIASYENLRRELIERASITSLVQLEYSGFEGATVPICCFTLNNRYKPKHKGAFIRLSTFRGAENQAPRTLEAIRNKECGWFYSTATEEFQKLPGWPIAYWLTSRTRECFATNAPLESICNIREGINTGDNTRFLRYWSEVDLLRISFTTQPAGAVEQKWVPHKKGGYFRRWYGNAEFVLNWEGNGVDIHSFHNLPLSFNGAPMRGKAHFFKESLSWSRISSGSFAIRYYPAGFSYDSTAPSIFTSPEFTAFVLGFLNSEVVTCLLAALSPTLDFRLTNIGNLPLALKTGDSDSRDSVNRVVSACMDLSRADWDNFETSWDFRDHPLLRPGLKSATLEASWQNWERHSTAAFRRMQELETENNRLFIAAYGLDGELEPEVPEEKITLARADVRKDVAAFLSYALGCMMGRYSLDKPGLIYAHAGNVDFDASQFATFPADEDGIVPVTEFAWFPDDAATRFEAFVKTLWHGSTLEENLAWVAESLDTKKDETPRETIRRYYATGLYKDHLQTYKKRPIYWLFSSGKERAFQALVYLHRYHEGTLARMRTEYVIPLQGRISGRIEQLREDLPRATSAAHSKKLQKELDLLRKQQVELHTFDEKLRHQADRRINLDLDDGVKVNYGKFGDLLAEVKAITGGKDEE